MSLNAIMLLDVGITHVSNVKWIQSVAMLFGDLFEISSTFGVISFDLLKCMTNLQQVPGERKEV